MDAHPSRSFRKRLSVIDDWADLSAVMLRSCVEHAALAPASRAADPDDLWLTSVYVVFLIAMLLQSRRRMTKHFALCAL